MLSTICRARCSLLLIGRTTQNFPIFSHILVNRNLASDARPKRPLGNYLLFCQEKRPHVVANNPDWSFVDVGKHLGEEWKSLSDLQKQSFNIRAKELLENYHREKDEFESSLTETELQELKQNDEVKKAAKEKRKNRAEMKKLDKPKRSRNSFAIFMTQNFQKGENVKSQVSRIADLWKNTSEEERLPYQEEAKRLKEEYSIVMESWKKRMIAEGREDLFEPKETKRTKLKRSSKKRKESKEVDELHEENDDGF